MADTQHTQLETLLGERILLLDGAMGTMIQRARLAEEDYRGARFRDWPRELSIAFNGHVFAQCDCRLGRLYRS